MSEPARIVRSHSLVDRDIPEIVPVSKSVVRHENRARQDVVLRRIDNRKAELMASSDMDTNREIIEEEFILSTEFYDRNLAKVGNSQVKQRKLAQSMALLDALNEGVVMRHAR